MKKSLRNKVIILISVISVVISVVALFVIAKGVGDVVETLYKEKSIDISDAIAVYMKEDIENINAVKSEILKVYNSTENKVISDERGTPEFEAYLAKFEFIQDMPEFKEVVERLRRIQDVLEIDCAYLTMIDAENETYFYIADAAYEDACPPGLIDPIYNIENSPLKNSGFTPNITNTDEYGWLITTGMPIYDENGEVVCYAAIDISMNDIMNTQNNFITVIVIVFVTLSLFLTFIGIRLVDDHVVKPIKSLSDAALKYEAGKENFASISINTNDEIEELSNSIKKMDNDVNDYIEQLKEAQERSARMEAAANVDSLTKVRNRRAYELKAAELVEDTRPYGIVMVDLNDLKGINDKYGHDKGDIAIKTICRIICHVFMHSPVYRIGGDEFVVLLMDSDFNDRELLFDKLDEELLKIFNDDSLEPWEAVSASYGYHIKEEGEAPDTVFKKADEQMYKNKTKFKKKYNMI